MPRHLSASAVVALAQDPARFASALRRPMPEPPALAARRGTAFHAWVEQHYAQAAMVDILDLPGSADDDPGDDADLPLMKERFLASEWAAPHPGRDRDRRRDGHRRDRRPRPHRRGLPARRAAASRSSTGRPGPSRPASRPGTRALQLAAYRVAFARLRGLDLDEVDAAFYYAGTGETVWPELPDDAALAALLEAVPDH